MYSFQYFRRHGNGEGRGSERHSIGISRLIAAFNVSMIMNSVSAQVFLDGEGRARPVSAVLPAPANIAKDPHRVGLRNKT